MVVAKIKTVEVIPFNTNNDWGFGGGIGVTTAKKNLNKSTQN